MFFGLNKEEEKRLRNALSAAQQESSRLNTELQVSREQIEGLQSSLDETRQRIDVTTRIQHSLLSFGESFVALAAKHPPAG